jgi:RNA polymerase sigma factor (sigma-70 family)
MTTVALDLRALTLDDLMAGFARASKEEYPSWMTEIQRRLHRRLARSLQNMGLSPHDVDDGIQDTWTAMIQYRDSFPQVKNGLAWVRHIAKREVQRKIRDQKRQKRAPQVLLPDQEEAEFDLDAQIFRIDNDNDNDDNDEQDEVDHEMKSPAEHAMAAETRERIRDYLSQLTDRQREIVELFYFLGLTHEQVAERLGLAVGTIKATLNQARTALRELLSDMEDQCTPLASES